MNVKRKIAANISRLCAERRLTQTECGEALGVSFQQNQKYQNASNRISADKLYELAKFFDVPIDAFYEGVDMCSEDRK